MKREKKVIVNNLDVVHLPLNSCHEPRLMSFTEYNVGTVSVSKMLSEAQVCFRMLTGMGVTTVTAARILKGQMDGKTGEETSLVMDTFPNLALSKVGAL